jgi:hypothetical protein
MTLLRQTVQAPGGFRSEFRIRSFLAVLVVALSACAPKLKPLPGESTPVSLPHVAMAPGHHMIFFDWKYSDSDLSGQGNGVARIAAPDSVRLDFFLAGGFGGGGAVLIGDSLDVPGADLARRLIPPPPLLWAALGRSAIPVTSDTAIHLDGALLRADLGSPVQWRATFRGDSLIRLERVDNDRIVEWVAIQADNRLEYRQEVSRRTLELHIPRVEDGAEFDSAIWHIDH